MIPYSRQFITPEDVELVIESLDKDIITRGPLVEQFERSVADYCGMKYGVAFNSGTSALYCAYRTIGLGGGDEFITSPISFCATSNMGVMLGARPVFVDVTETGHINPERIEEKITDKTKMIVPVDYGGHPVDRKQINSIADEHDIFVVNDCCHSLGSKYYSDRVDMDASMNVFSFHPVKTITTGEGGMVMTDDKRDYEKLLQLRNHGLVHKSRWLYGLDDICFNFHITDFQCALGLSQLSRIDKIIEDRHSIFHSYNCGLKYESFLTLPSEQSCVSSSHHLYPIRVRHQLDRTMIYDELHKRGIMVQVHYIPIYLFDYYKNMFGYKKGLCPVAERFYDSVLSLPCHLGMNAVDIMDVIKNVKEVLEYVQISTYQ